MQQFTVPQFIEVEPKVIGPISVRQFLMLLVGAFLLFIEYKLVDFALFIVEGLATIAIATIFTFIKINGRPFHFFLLSFVRSFLRPKVRIWVKDDYWRTNLAVKAAAAIKTDLALESSLQTKQRKMRHLTELALQVDTGGEYRESMTNF